MGVLLRLVAVAALTSLAMVSVALADEPWIIREFHADIAIQGDGSFTVEERIVVDFGRLERHGIFRYVPYRYHFDDTRERVYAFTVLAVTDAAGQSWRYEESREAGNVVLKIGDPDRTVTGPQTYRIRYSVRDALNSFPDHDELNWNVNGTKWPVPASAVSANVTLPADGVQAVTCYQGHLGSTEACRATSTARSATFAATRPFASGENLTVVVSLRKGVVLDPRPRLERRARTPDEYIEVTPATLGTSAFVLLVGVALVGYNWYRRGRDRVYSTNYYLTNDPAESVRPLVGGRAVVPEYEPPKGIRAAQMGLLLDKSADPKDVTATIVDLASRGYLTIAEVPKQGVFGRRDWELTRVKAPLPGELAEYERIIFDGLFSGVRKVTVSELKGTFVTALDSAQKELYRDAVAKGWFPTDPQKTRTLWAVIGFLAMLAGGLLAIALALTLGAALIGLAVVVVGIVLLFLSKAMPARTAKGSELLRRILGFRLYMLTAEKERQRFAEREGIFSAYLPYAVVLGCVERWAAAFRDLGAGAAAAAAPAWYIGTGTFNASAFSSDLQSFSSSLSASVASTPGASGGSGFSGGSSGGGGGGGGGGSW